ncbi:MAG: hypothetical protein ABIA91_03080 [Patescibacteria group bacterium]
MAGTEKEDGLGGQIFGLKTDDVGKDRIFRVNENENFCIYCGAVGANHTCERTSAPPKVL